MSNFTLILSSTRNFNSSQDARDILRDFERARNEFKNLGQEGLGRFVAEHLEFAVTQALVRDRNKLVTFFNNDAAKDIRRRVGARVAQKMFGRK